MVVNNLSYQRGTTKLLKDISFSIAIEEKGLHGLLAPQMAGKSLLMDLLAGCLDAHSGDIMIRKQKMSVANSRLRAKIGYVPQKSAFYADMTAAELLNFVGEIRQVSADKRYRQISEALELTGLGERGDALTRNLNSKEKKKLSFAAALLGNTELLLLDEPFWGQNEEERRECLELLGMLGKHKSVLIASRSLSLLRSLCSDVLLMSDGILLAHNSFENLETQLRKQGFPSLEEFYNDLSVKAEVCANMERFSEANDSRKEINQC